MIEIYHIMADELCWICRLHGQEMRYSDTLTEKGSFEEGWKQHGWAPNCSSPHSTLSYLFIDSIFAFTSVTKSLTAYLPPFLSRLNGWSPCITSSCMLSLVGKSTLSFWFGKLYIYQMITWVLFKIFRSFLRFGNWVAIGSMRICWAVVGHYRFGFRMKFFSLDCHS